MLNLMINTSYNKECDDDKRVYKKLFTNSPKSPRISLMSSISNRGIKSARKA